MEQCTYGLVQSAGDGSDIVEAHISLAAFDAAVVAPVEAADRGKSFLRVSFGLAKLSYALTEDRANRRLIRHQQAKERSSRPAIMCERYRINDFESTGYEHHWEGRLGLGTFYELFAGIGLVREALEPLGWKCVYANDFDKTKQAIYAVRFPDHEDFDGRNLWKVNASELPKPVDLVAASFPCIDLSLAGNRKGLAGDDSGAFWAFVRILEQLRHEGEAPSALMIENVTGFLSSNGGRDFDMAVRALNGLGYAIDAVQITAEHFTPQSRPRLFVLGLRDDLAETTMTLPENVGRGEWVRAVNSNPILRPSRVRNLMLKEGEPPVQTSLDDEPSEGEEGLRWGCIEFPNPPLRTETFAEIVDWQEGSWWDAERTQRALQEMNPRHWRKIEEMMQSGEQHAATAYRRRRNGESVYEIRNDGVAGCLRTARGGSSTQIVVVVEDGEVKMRWMNPREYARLQGSEYQEGLDAFGKASLRTAFGDAVCVPAVRWVAEHAFSTLPEDAAVEDALALTRSSIRP